MKLGLIGSAWAGSEFDGVAGLAKAREIGFQSYDLTVDPLDLAPEELSRFTFQVREVGIPISSILVIAVGLSDFIPSVRQFHVERVKRHVEFAAEVNATNVVIGLGEYIWQHQVIPPERQWHWAIESVQQLADYAATFQLQIGIELESCDLSLINSVDRLRQFVATVDRENVGYNVDCSHLWLRRIDATEIAKLRGGVIHTHFSDCNGETHGDLPPGRGSAPLQSYLMRLRELGYHGTLAVELEWPAVPDRAVEVVEEAYAATRTLMEKVGVWEPAQQPADPADWGVGTSRRSLV
jgi:sugar phosphate isomerase/epimerase